MDPDIRALAAALAADQVELAQVAQENARLLSELVTIDTAGADRPTGAGGEEPPPRQAGVALPGGALAPDVLRIAENGARLLGMSVEAYLREAVMAYSLDRARGARENARRVRGEAEAVGSQSTQQVHRSARLAGGDGDSEPPAQDGAQPPAPVPDAVDAASGKPLPLTRQTGTKAAATPTAARPSPTRPPRKRAS